MKKIQNVCMTAFVVMFLLLQFGMALKGLSDPHLGQFEDAERRVSNMGWVESQEDSRSLLKTKNNSQAKLRQTNTADAFDIEDEEEAAINSPEKPNTTCFNKNIFIKHLWTRGVDLYEKPRCSKQISSHCGTLWRGHGTCCKIDSLLNYTDKQFEIIRNATFKVNVRFNSFHSHLKTIFNKTSRLALNKPELLTDTQAASNKTIKNVIAVVNRIQSPEINSFRNLLNALNDTSEFNSSNIKCWQYIAKVRSYSLCETCAGNSQQYFSKNLAVISEDLCDKVLSECAKSFDMIVDFIEVVGIISDQLEKTYKKEISSKKFKSIFQSAIVKKEKDRHRKEKNKKKEEMNQRKEKNQKMKEKNKKKEEMNQRKEKNQKMKEKKKKKEEMKERREEKKEVKREKRANDNTSKKISKTDKKNIKDVGKKRKLMQARCLNKKFNAKNQKNIPQTLTKKICSKITQAPQHAPSQKSNWNAKVDSRPKNNGASNYPKPKNPTPKAQSQKLHSLNGPKTCSLVKSPSEHKSNPVSHNKTIEEKVNKELKTGDGLLSQKISELTENDEEEKAVLCSQFLRINRIPFIETLAKYFYVNEELFNDFSNDLNSVLKSVATCPVSSATEFNESIMDEIIEQSILNKTSDDWPLKPKAAPTAVDQSYTTSDTSTLCIAGSTEFSKNHLKGNSRKLTKLLEIPGQILAHNFATTEELQVESMKQPDRNIFEGDVKVASNIDSSYTSYFGAIGTTSVVKRGHIFNLTSAFP